MDKQELRRVLKQKRNALSLEEKKEKDEAIRQSILSSRAWRRADTVLLYAPLAGEPDLIPLVKEARRAGKQVAFPRCDTETGSMTFHILETGKKLFPGAYGIPEPTADYPLLSPSPRTLCLIPALSLDPHGNRLGWGKGYYDRFLTGFEGVKAGVVHRDMMLSQLPTDDGDVPVDLIFTDRGERSCGTPASSPKNLREFAESLWQKTRTLGRNIWTLWHKKEGLRPLHIPALGILTVFVLLLCLRPLSALLSNRQNQALITLLCQLLVFVLPCTLYFFLRGGKKRLPALRLRPPLPRYIWFTVTALMVLITGTMLLQILTGGVKTLESGFTLYASFAARTGGVWQTVLAVLAWCILPSLCEEFLFRGLLMAEYEPYGRGVAMMATSLFFAMLHFSLPLFPSYFFAGLLLSLVLYATGSLFSGVILHFLYNLFCLFGQPFLSAFYLRAGSSRIFLFLLTLLFLLFGALMAGEAKKLYHRHARDGIGAPKEASSPWRRSPRRLAILLFSPAALVAALVWLIAAALGISA